jgi:hypothetical protein
MLRGVAGCERHDVESTFREHLSAAIDVVAAAADLDPRVSA